MTHATEVKEMVKAYEAINTAKILAEANEMIERIDTNIIERATRGHKFLDFGLNGWDRNATEMAAEIIVEAGYTIRFNGHFLRIEW
jgi:phosphoheptose isomerase